jgi:hypothetical protein
MIGSLSRDDRERHAGGMPPSDHEAVAAEPNSFTGQYLKPLLARSTTVIPANAGTQPSKKPRRRASSSDLFNPSPDDESGRSPGPRSGNPDLIPVK